MIDQLTLLALGPISWTLIMVGASLIGLAIYDISQKSHAIWHNFPVIGHLRYLLEMIGPELRQYWVAGDKEEQPFNRDERSWVYRSSKNINSNFGFGTTEQVYGIGYPIIKQAGFPFPECHRTIINDDPTAIPCAKIMGEFHGRAKPYRPRSIINVSGMSFGSLSGPAVEAINIGCRESSCFQNTGEGGISSYHCNGADLMWQIGTGYFGARDENGFSLDVMMERIEQVKTVRCIEIKLSQGAKPGKGGILPGRKVSAEIAQIRGVPLGKDCISPNAHTQFSTVDELINFTETVAERTGLPIGIKSAIGKTDFWEELAARMHARNQGPDFITIDGCEGGTGAAPLTYADHVSLPFKIGFARVYQIFQNQGVSERVVWIGSGKLGFPDRAIVALAMGCDLIQVGREAMMSIGCIQALKCHTDHCPSGVATQNRWLSAGVDVPKKSNRFANYVRNFRLELLSLAHSAGYQHPSQFDGNDIEFSTGVNSFSTLCEVLRYTKDPSSFSMNPTEENNSVTSRLEQDSESKNCQKIKNESTNL